MEGHAVDKFQIGHFEFSWPIGLALDLGNVFMTLVTTMAVILAYLEWKKEKRTEATTKERHREEDARERQRDLEVKERHREEDENARILEVRSTAKRLYMDYLTLAFNNPRMATGKYDPSSEEECSQYDYYLSMVLWIMDEYIGTGFDNFCVPALKTEIKTHADYIRTILHIRDAEDSSYRAGYSVRFLEILDETFDEIDHEKKVQSFA